MMEDPNIVEDPTQGCMADSSISSMGGSPTTDIPIFTEHSKRFTNIFEHFSKVEQSPLESFYIDNEIREQIVFKEELEVINVGSSKDIGVANIKIMREGPGHEYFLIRSSVSGRINGAKCGATIISCVDRNFQTMNERRTEYEIPDEDGLKTCPIEMKVFFSRGASSYYCSAVHKHGEPEHVDKTEMQIPHICTKYLIAEGANLLLLRYLAITGYRGEFDAVTILLDGRLRITNYTCSGYQDHKVNGMTVSVVSIERVIQTSKQRHDTMVTIVSRKGQVLEHTWDEGMYKCRVRTWQGVDRTIIDETVNYTIPLHLCWEGDMVMMSEYQDKIVRQKASHKSYLLDHPELRSIVSDFIQSVLLLKPDQVVPFAIDHFKTYRYDDTIEERFAEMYVQRPRAPSVDYHYKREVAESLLELNPRMSPGPNTAPLIELLEKKKDDKNILDNQA